MITSSIPGTRSLQFTEGRQAFETSVADLARRFPGSHYAVFVGSLFLGAFRKYGDALAAGYEKAGNTSFFVKQIKSANEVRCVVSTIAIGQ